MPQTAKVFRTGRSQAVRLPAAFRFAGSEVYIRRDPETGDVILSAKPGDWTALFAAIDAVDGPADAFMTGGATGRPSAGIHCEPSDHARHQHGERADQEPVAAPARPRRGDAGGAHLHFRHHPGGVALRPGQDAADQACRAAQRFLATIPIMPWDSAAAETYGGLRAGLERAGTPLGALDTLIAAHALALDAQLITADKAFAQAPGLAVADWTR